MNKTTSLTQTQLQALLGHSLQGWAYQVANHQQPACLTKQWQFEDFQQAFAFMQRVATIAEAHNHHPDWQNCYNRLWITLTTHDAGGITQQDVAFIKAVALLEDA